jgi:peptidoglycan-associated lipoprotein
MSKNKLLLSMLCVAALSLGGCASDPSTQDGDGAGATTGKMSAERMKQLIAKRTVYFEFDSSTLVGENLEIVQAHGQNLASSKAKVSLEGHADERGTREYNLALGERRGQSVERVMRALGVGSDRVKVTSFGEEKPVAKGSDEAAWSKNRRVEIIY